MRRSFYLLVSIALAAPAGAAPRAQRKAKEAYEGARRAYYSLKADSKRRQYRHQWLAAIDRFEAVAKAYPTFEKAPEALYTSAELLADLSQISMLPEDLNRAVVDYRRVIDKHPKHRLADDAALMLARIYAQRLDVPEQAEAILAEAQKKLGAGDRTKEIAAMRSQLVASLDKAAQAKAKDKAPERVAEKEKPPEKAPERVAERPDRPVAEKAPPKPEPDRSAHRMVERANEPGAPKARIEEHAATTSATVEAIARMVQQRDQEAKTPPAAAPPAQPPEPTETAQRGGTTPPGPASGPTIPPVAVSPPPQPAKPSAPVAPAVVLKRLQAGREKEITIAEQLGLKVRRVVIDAGHGGHDPGAVGPSGAEEKDVALSIALKLGEVLESQGLEVVYTRRDDTFLPLEKRARLANEARGDLFISIHCNSAQSKKLHGVETYSLNIAADRYSIRLAARENSSSEKGISDLQFILADLATKANTEESQRLAQRVQNTLSSGLSAKYSAVQDLGTKQALFYVLLGARMPAILVETSFVSNPEEERRLKSPEYQADVAQGIASGVGEFLGNRSRLAKVEQ